MTAPPLAPDAKHYRSQTTLTMRGADQGLPAGVCGQVEGIAMVYGVVDTHGTTFSKGCLDRTVRQRVAAGQVRLFLDHGDLPQNGMYSTDKHIGVVRSVVDEQGPDGKWQARFSADLLDSERGRAAHEYLRAIAATGSETGVSIGMLKEPSTTRCVVDGQVALRIDEVALGEISITAMSSVPGTRVTAVRADMQSEAVLAASDNLAMSPVPRFSNDTVTLASVGVDYFALLDGIVAHLGAETVRAHLGATIGDAVMEDRDAEHTSDTDASHSDSPGDSRDGTEPPAPNVPVDDRLAFVRANLQRLYE